MIIDFRYFTNHNTHTMNKKQISVYLLADENTEVIKVDGACRIKKNYRKENEGLIRSTIKFP